MYLWGLLVVLICMVGLVLNFDCVLAIATYLRLIGGLRVLLSLCCI